MSSRRQSKQKKAVHGNHFEKSDRFNFRTVGIFLLSVIVLFVSWVLIREAKTVQFKLSDTLPRMSETFLEATLRHYYPDAEFADEILKNITSMLRPSWLKPEFGDSSSPGLILRKQGARAHFPVIIIPGIISTGLELWEGKECAKPYFRERLWGTLTMLRALILDRKCWMEHMRLDEMSGSDPDGIRIRAAQGLEAADFLMPGFWVWARIIQNLAELGYDQNNMLLASYDWRLDVLNLEKRDKYFSRLKNNIEMLHRFNSKKLAVVTHSLGSSIWYYFMKWVEASPDKNNGVGGNGGKAWISDHIETVINIGGTFLGVPKSISTVLSGESRETAALGKIESYFLELFLSRSERVDLFRTWSGGFGILPKGGNVIWGGPGNKSSDFGQLDEAIPLVTLKSERCSTVGKYFAEDISMLYKDYLPKKIESYTLHSNGMAKNRAEIERNENNFRKWMNPLESRLPFAAEMTIYCLHGIGKATERGYIYKECSQDGKKEVVLDIDSTYETASRGVLSGEGDGTVPLLSLGYMACKGWNYYEYLNPAKIKVITREYRDDPTKSRVTDVRGGPKSGDHVDILGNHDLTLDILRIVSNCSEKLEDNIHSNIREIAGNINLPFEDIDK